MQSIIALVVGKFDCPQSTALESPGACGRLGTADTTLLANRGPAMHERFYV